MTVSELTTLRTTAMTTLQTLLASPFASYSASQRNVVEKQIKDVKAFIEDCDRQIAAASAGNFFVAQARDPE